MNLPSLKTILRANAIFSILCAVDLMFFPSLISRWMGIDNPVYLIILAFGLLIFAAYMIVLTLKSSIKKNQALTIIAADLTWVLGSVCLLAFNPFQLTSLGLFFVLGVAVVVFTFAVLQFNATRQECDVPS